MDAQVKQPAAEIKRLQRCINDLVGIVALPAAWRPGDQARIAETLLDALQGLLHLDLAYLRLKDADAVAPIEIARVPRLPVLSARPHDVGALLDERMEREPRAWVTPARIRIAETDLSIVVLNLGLDGELGLLVAGSERCDFPGDTDKLLLTVAANQAALGLQQARQLGDQRRIAEELDRRVAERTEELAAVNSQLRKEIAERTRFEEVLRARELDARLIVDSIPALVALMTPAGAVELVNRQVLEYFGKTLDALKAWGTADDVHPDDLPRVTQAFAESIRTGHPYEVEHRLRRADGAYRWFHARGLPLRDANGCVVRWYVLLTDVNDRKRAEEALSTSEQNLKLIINTIPALAWSAPPDGSAEFFNQHFLDYIGLSAEQAQDWGWTSAVHPDDLGAMVDAWRTMTISGSAGSSEARLRRHDGEYRWFLFRANPLRSRDGSIVQWYGINTDIEELKRAEEKVRLIVDTALDAVIAMDADGLITNWNKQAAAIFGWSEQEAIGRVMSELIIPPSQRSAHERGLKHFLATGEGPILRRRIEVTAIRRSGAEFPVELEVMPVRLGQLWVFSAFIRDVTESRQAQEKLRESEFNLRQIVETIPEMLWSATADGTVDYCNARLLEYSGLRADEVMLDNGSQRIHPEEVDRAVREWRSCVASGAPYQSEFRTFHAPDGTYRWCVTSARPLFDAHGRIIRWHGAVIDVHDWKHAQEVLRDTQAALAHMTRVTTLGELTASIAHEVNQPLAGIISNASACLRMLAADPPNLDGARETVRRTIRDGNRAADVITRLRSLFGKKSVNSETVDLNEAAREVIALSSGELQRSRVIVRTELGEDLPAVTGDRIQLQQVILNFLLNAADAMRGIDDRPRLLVVRTEHDGDDQVRVSLRDTGVGLDPRNAKHLFEAFHTTKADGMGIGLSVSRSIIEGHHGRIWAAPNEGPGATFSFCVPRTRPDTAGSASPAPGS